jgi:hypothetical protein
MSTQWCSLQDRYIRRQKIHTVTFTGSGWSLRTLTTLWNDFFELWQTRNASIHGHDLASQQIARKRKLGVEMEVLHEQRDSVLACDSDAFIGDTPADLTKYLDHATATQVQNWLYTWKPFIQSSIKSAKDLSIHGVRIMSTYFPTTDTAPRPPNLRAHRTARPRDRPRRPLPKPSYRFRSLKSFFGTTPRPDPPT